MTEQRDQWKALEIRRPGDVPVPTPLAWQIEKHGEHSDRLMNNMLPVDFPYEVERGTADDALAVLALRESIRRDIESGTGNRVHEALTLGATWTQVAAALDLDPGQARDVLRSYADGQRNLWLGYEKERVKPFGFSADQHAAALALCELGDDEDYSDAATADAVMPRDPVELAEMAGGAWIEDDDELPEEEREEIGREILRGDSDRPKPQDVEAETQDVVDERAVKGCTHPSDEACFGKPSTPRPEPYEDTTLPPQLRVALERMSARGKVVELTSSRPMPGSSYKLTVNAKEVTEGTLPEVKAAVADLVTRRVGAEPERVSQEAALLNMAFNQGGEVETLLKERGQWFTVFDAYGKEPLRIRVTKEEE